MAQWNQTRDFDGPLLAEEYERSDGKFRVGSNRMTRGTQRPYYVQERYGSRRGYANSPHFRKRFASSEAAIAAVDKRCPA